MATGRTNVGGGLNINGIIKQYKIKAGNNISAGDFVEFIKDLPLVKSNASSISLNPAGDSNYINCILLSDTSVLMIINVYQNSTNYVYGMVIKINGTSLTTGTQYSIIGATANLGTCIPMRVSNNCVVVMYHITTSTPEYWEYGNLYVRVLSISDTTITIGTQYALVSNGYSLEYTYHMNTVLLNGNLMVSYGRKSSSSMSATSYACARVLSISGTTITIGTELILSTVTGMANTRMYGRLLPSGNILIVTSDMSVTCKILTVNGTTLSAGAVCNITSTIGVNGMGLFIDDNVITNSFIRIISLSSDNMLLIYQAYDGSTTAVIVARVLSVNGTTVSTGVEYKVSTTSADMMTNTGWFLENPPAILDDNKIILVYCKRQWGVDSNIYARVLSISGTTITMGTECTIASNAYNIQILSSIKTPSGAVSIYMNQYNSTLNMVGLTIDGTAITVVPYTGVNISPVYGYINKVTQHGDGCIIHSGTNNIAVLTLSDLIKSYSTKINGVAKSNGSADQTIDVFVPK